MWVLSSKERERIVLIFERCGGGKCARVEKANFVRRQNIFIYSPKKVSYMLDDRPRWELANKSRAIQLSDFSNRYICMDVVTYGRCWALASKDGFSAICLFVCGFIWYVPPYWWHLYLNFDMHNVRENRTSSTARFPPGTCVWVCPRNLVSFSWLRDEFFFKKNQIL